MTSFRASAVDATAWKLLNERVSSDFLPVPPPQLPATVLFLFPMQLEQAGVVDLISQVAFLVS